MACLMASRKVTGSPCPLAPCAAAPLAEDFFVSAMGYLRAFPAGTLFFALKVAAALREVFAADFAVPLVTILAGALGANLASLSASSSAEAVSPKWMGAFFPPEPFPSPKPATFQTAATLERGGVTSAWLRSHFAAILWQSSPVQ